MHQCRLVQYVHFAGVQYVQKAGSINLPTATVGSHESQFMSLTVEIYGTLPLRPATMNQINLKANVEKNLNYKQPFAVAVEVTRGCWS